jgi:hypothetical protein
MTYDTVVKASRHFSTLAEADSLTKIHPLTAAERSRLLETVRAEIVVGTDRSDHGIVPVDLVQFRRPGIAQWVLDYLWRHAHHLREPILGWLAETADITDTRVQRKFAAAVGQLMTRDFSALHARIFAGWMASESIGKREAALVAMAVASEHPKLRLVIVQMALSWRRGEYWTKWMAARSFGEPLGYLDPDATLAILGELARDKELLPYAVSQALTEFADGTTDDRFEQVLSVVNEWTKDRDVRKRHVGIYAFLQMCMRIKDVGRQLPRMLTRPTRHDDDPAIAMWRRAITDEKLHLVTRNVLFGWARSSELVESGPDRLARLLARTAITYRLAFLIRSMANTWHADMHPAPRSADAVLEAIPEWEGDCP